MNKKILRIDEQIKRLQEKRKEIIETTIANCKHDTIVEIPYRPNDWGYSDPPLLLCTDCGLAEESWGVGNKILSPKKCNTVLKNRQEGFALATKVIKQERCYDESW